MIRAIWNGTVLAEAESTRVVEGNHYFPLDSVNQDLLQKSRFHTVCYWKGLASYYHLSVNGEQVKNFAWYYPHPPIWIRGIRDHVAFLPVVRIVQAP